MKRLLILIIILILILVGIDAATKYFPALQGKFNFANSTIAPQTVKVVNEESNAINTVKKVRPAVVAVGVPNSPQSNANTPDTSPFSFFFNGQPQNPFSTPGAPDNSSQNAQQLIGSGFIIQKEGLIVTNKHVVSDTSVKYVVVDDRGNKYNVTQIYRDPLNDVALIKVADAPTGGFPVVELGNSSGLQVGQTVLAFGTPLGEFQNTVTHGIISGLGRGITAGSQFEGFVEQLDNVIQTDAAISPGNSGGPLVNIAGQVVGINTAIAQQGQNIGFAIPINVIRDSINNFNQTGQFNRPFLGVSYQMISKQAAIMNNLPQGAYVGSVVAGSSADHAGIQKDDVITKIDGQNVSDTNTSIAAIIGKKKVGDTVSITLIRDGKTMDVTATLQTAPNQ